MTVTTSQVRRYHRSIDRLRRRMIAAAAATWAITDGIAETDRLEFLSTIEPYVIAGQTQAGAIVSSYLTAATGESLGRPELDHSVLRNGAAFADVYSRPFVTARTGLAEGKAYTAAVGEGLQRLRHLASTDVQLAHRDAARQLMQRSKRIVGYRRVLTGESCPLCAVASTQRYRTNQLMPLHDHCDCSLAPIIGDSDPGRVINRDLLHEVQTASDRPDYWNDRRFKVSADGAIVDRDDKPFAVAVVEHGEKGPWLTDASHQFATI